MTDCVFVYVTASNQEEARRIARSAVEERLAACANVLGPIESYYYWEGKFESGAETALVLKTSRAKLDALTERLRALHSYSCPAIVALPIVGGHPPFLAWIRAEVGDV
jgi:periplasmic divalent cation tolerance protein